MIFEQVATGGCQSYLIGCADTCAGALIDPEASQIDRYLGLAARDGLRIRFLIDTHTQCRAQRRSHPFRFAHGPQIDETNAEGALFCETMSCGNRQRRFSDASRADDGHEPISLQLFGELIEFDLTSHHMRESCRQ